MLIAEPLLGTRAEVSATASSTTIAKGIELAAFAEAERLESIFTIFDASSGLRALRNTGSTTIAELIEVRRLAYEWMERTSGAFHPAMQPIVDCWIAAETTGQRPQRDALDRGVALAGETRPEHLDFNGIAKGWIADRSLKVAIDSSPESATSLWISLGGDLVHWGQGSIRVGIENPHRPYDNIAPMATVELSNEALATSGSGRRWFSVGDERFSKVIDPRTGEPCTDVSSASVIAPTAALADVLATTALVFDPEQTMALVEAEGSACLLVLDDESVVRSARWPTPA